MDGSGKETNTANERLEIGRQTKTILRLCSCIGLLFITLAVNAGGEDQSLEAGSKVMANPPFLLSDEKLSKTLTGIDVEQLVTSIGRNYPSDKSEFESEADYEKRFEKWESKPLMGKIAAGSLLAIVTPLRTVPTNFDGSPQLEISYDAESEMMKVDVEGSWDCPSAPDKSLLLKKVTRQTGEYVAQNAYGAKKKVFILDRSSICTDVKNLSLGFSVPKQTARAERESMKLVIIGRLVRPYLRIMKSQLGATMRSPTEEKLTARSLALDIEALWLVSGLTGKIFTK